MRKGDRKEKRVGMWERSAKERNVQLDAERKMQEGICG